MIRARISMNLHFILVLHIVFQSTNVFQILYYVVSWDYKTFLHFLRHFGQIFVL